MKLKKINPSNGLFLFGYILFIIYKIIRNSVLNIMLPIGILNFFRLSTLILCLISIIGKKRISKKYFIRSIFFLFVSTIVYYYCGSLDIVIASVIIITSYNVNLKKIINVSFYTNLILVLIIFVLSISGTIPNYTFERYNIFGHIVHAKAYGFTYYSTLPFLVLYISLMLIYKSNMKKIIIICLLAINIFLYLLSTAKMPIIVFMITCLITFAFNKLKYNRIDWKYISSIPIIGLIISIMVSVLYPLHIKLIDMLNFVTANRVAYGYRGLTEYGIKLFGNKLQMIGASAMSYGTSKNIGSWQYFYIDNSYLYTLLEYGLVFTVAIIWGYCKLINYSIEKEDIFLFIWIVATLIFALINDNLISVEYNILPIIATKIFLGENKSVYKIIHKEKR